LDSPFVTHFAASPLGAKVARSPEADTLRRGKAHVEAPLRPPLAPLPHHVLRGALILPPPPGPGPNPPDAPGMLAPYAPEPAPRGGRPGCTGVSTRCSGGPANSRKSWSANTAA